MNIKDATMKWVKEFTFIPQDMIAKLMMSDENCVREITPPTEYDRVYFYDRPYNAISYTGEIKERTDGGLYVIEMDDGVEIFASKEDFAVDREYPLPAWGMWSFGNPLDNRWLEEEGGPQIMADCGFRVFDTDWGYYFGIDSAGYDFYEYHWIPLYEERGLHWHTEGAA